MTSSKRGVESALSCPHALYLSFTHRTRPRLRLQHSIPRPCLGLRPVSRGGVITTTWHARSGGHHGRHGLDRGYVLYTQHPVPECRSSAPLPPPSTFFLLTANATQQAGASTWGSSRPSSRLTGKARAGSCASHPSTSTATRCVRCVCCLRSTTLPVFLTFLCFATRLFFPPCLPHSPAPLLAEPARQVTNDDFAAFIAATRFQTENEKFGWSFVFEGLLTEEVLQNVTQAVAGAGAWVAPWSACMHCLAGMRVRMQGLLRACSDNVPW